MLNLKFDNRFVVKLPGDKELRNFVRQVPMAIWSEAAPTPVSSPKTLAVSAAMCQALGLSPEQAQSQEFTEVFAGNRLLDGMKPVAARYGGHQFGHWAGQLGDGRAIYLGEVVTVSGERLELQLKGAGPTPYSRRGDGRAVLRSSLREFLCSEAMHHLGVPTTRALSLVSTGDPVMRDMFYDGNPAPEPGAVVCRVSPSFLRFGNYEIHASSGEHALLNQLIDFTIEHYFPEFLNDRLGWFREVCRRTARLMVDWMRVGFVHGVMNTDNLSILGLTIDYGPYGWIDNYDPLWTPNTTDLPRRRYCFGRQPEIAQWNLLRLADALSAVVEPAEDLSSGIELFVDTYNRESAKMTAAKFGLSEAENDLVLAKQAYALMARHEMDMTVFFRCLSENRDIGPSYYGAKDGEGWLEWLAQYGQRVAQIGRPEAERLAAMQAVNPWFIPRNYLAQVAIEAAEQGDLSELEQLMKAAQSPYSRESLPAEFSKFGAIRPDWARQKAGCSALSCSS